MKQSTLNVIQQDQYGRTLDIFPMSPRLIWTPIGTLMPEAVTHIDVIRKLHPLHNVLVELPTGTLFNLTREYGFVN